MDIAPALQWLEVGALPEWEEVKGLSPFMRAFFRQFDSLVLHSGVMYRTFVDGNGRPTCYQIVLPRELRLQFMAVIHGDSAGHSMFEKSMKLLQTKAWWFTYRNDLENFIKACDNCASLFGNKHQPKQSNLQPSQVCMPGE